MTDARDEHGLSLAGGPTNGILGDLAKRRQQIVEEELFEKWVPRWQDPRIKLVFDPVPHTALKKAAMIQEQNRKERDPDRRALLELNTNADLLITAVREISVHPIDGSDGGSVSHFGPSLATALGMPDTARARDVCRAIFITDADLLTMARELSEWTGYREDDANEVIAGE
jgi:hypothetical protein